MCTPLCYRQPFPCRLAAIWVVCLCGLYEGGVASFSSPLTPTLRGQSQLPKEVSSRAGCALSASSIAGSFSPYHSLIKYQMASPAPGQLWSLWSSHDDLKQKYLWAMPLLGRIASAKTLLPNNPKEWAITRSPVCWHQPQPAACGTAGRRALVFPHLPASLCCLLLLL